MAGGVDLAAPVCHAVFAADGVRDEAADGAAGAADAELPVTDFAVGAGVAGLAFSGLATLSVVGNWDV